MKTQTGRLANPKKRRKPRKAAATVRRRKPAVAAAPARRRRRRRNPGVIPQRATNPRRKRSANPTRRRRKAPQSGGFLLTSSGKVARRRRNPSGGMVVGGVHIGETAMMIISGGVAAFAGAIVVRFVDDRIAKKWPRVLTKLGAAFGIGFVGMKAAESEGMGGMIVLPISIGLGAPMIASAIADIFGVDAASGGNKSAAKTAAEDDGLDDDIDDMEGIDPMDEVDDDIDGLAEDDDDDDDAEDMNGWTSTRALESEVRGMNAAVGANPTKRMDFTTNWMQGLMPHRGD